MVVVCDEGAGGVMVERRKDKVREIRKMVVVMVLKTQG